MQLIQGAVRNPVKVTVGVLLVALFGTISLFRMPMQLTPEVQIPTLTIETAWPGASPQEVEQEIIQEQEEQLKGVEGATKLTSESMDSMGRITIEFAIGTDLSEALLRVNTRLQQVKDYPADAREPTIRTANLSDRPIAWFVMGPRPPEDADFQAFLQNYPQHAERVAKARKAASDGVMVYRLIGLTADFPEFKEVLPPDIDVTKLRKFGEDVIKARFERVPGVSISNVLGGQEEEMQVVVDPEKLAARGVTIEDLRRALQGQNKDTSAGDFYEGKRRYVVRTVAQFRSIQEIEDTVIAFDDRDPIYVRDVIEPNGVRHGHKKPDGLVRRFGQERLTFNVIRATGANVLDVMDGLRQATNELNDGVLKQRGLFLNQVYDETEYIYSAVGLVNNNILIGGSLTVLVLLLFLRSGRSTLVIGLAIPTSIIGSFLVLNLLGRSLNVISLAGLAFAVGMLVDNAVVVLENIYRHHQSGKSPFKAATDGASEVWGAILASTLTTLAVFVPVLFVEEEAGQLFRDIALAISAGISLSLIVSLTLIPMASARLLRKQDEEASAEGTDPVLAVQRNGEVHPHRHSLFKRVAHSRPVRASTSFFRRVGQRVVKPFYLLGRSFSAGIIYFNTLMQKSVPLRLGVVGGFVGLSIFLSLLLMPKVEYLPTGNRNLVIAILLPPPGYNIDHVRTISEQVEKDLRPYWDIDVDDPQIKEMKYPAIQDYFFVFRGKQVFLGVRSLDPTRAGDLIPLIRQVTTGIPGTFAVAKQSSLFEAGLTAGRTIDIEITGPDLRKLVRLGGQVLGQVRDIMPTAQAVPQPSLDLSAPEVHVIPRREQAAQMGMKADEIGYAVDALIDGAYVADFITGGIKVDLRIIGAERLASQTHSIQSLPIATPFSPTPVPLEALATVRIASGPEQINHRERQRAITIQVTPPPQMALEDAMDQITEQIVRPLQEGDELEGGTYLLTLAGTSDKLRATWQALRFNVILALLITYLLMAALFESWLYPFVVILSVPLGAVGGFAALALLNLFVLAPLDVLTMLGFVILIGTVVNNPILIVEQTLIHMREERLPMQQALLESVRNRIRPIFMTTTTTLFGLMPLVLFPGAGSELYRGLGAVVLGGLLVSTLVTLVVIPAVFSLCMQAKEALALLLGLETEFSRPREDEQKSSAPRELSQPVS